MSFSISIHKNPVLVLDERRECEVLQWDESEGDRILNFIIDEKDFDEIQKIVGVSLPPTKQFEGENYGEYNKRLKTEYFKAAAENGYEMLGRFWDWYDDAIYFSSEVIQLRNECLKVKSDSQNSDLVIAIDKVLFDCKDALKTGSGICFGCD